jgi:hypothetical protein
MLRRTASFHATTVHLANCPAPAAPESDATTITTATVLDNARPAQSFVDHGIATATTVTCSAAVTAYTAVSSSIVSL